MSDNTESLIVQLKQIVDSEKSSVAGEAASNILNCWNDKIDKYQFKQELKDLDYLIKSSNSNETKVLKRVKKLALSLFSSII